MLRVEMPGTLLAILGGVLLIFAHGGFGILREPAYRWLHPKLGIVIVILALGHAMMRIKKRAISLAEQAPEGPEAEMRLKRLVSAHAMCAILVLLAAVGAAYLGIAKPGLAVSR